MKSFVNVLFVAVLIFTGLVAFGCAAPLSTDLSTDLSNLDLSNWKDVMSQWLDKTGYIQPIIDDIASDVKDVIPSK